MRKETLFAAASLAVCLCSVLRPSSVLADLLEWEQISERGFGNLNNYAAFSSAEYDGNLYVGTHNITEGCEIWRFDGPSTSNWTKVSLNGFGNSKNQIPYSMAVYQDKLYVGARNNTANGFEIWSYDGAAWGFVTNALGLGDADLKNPSAMLVFDEKLILGTGNSWTDNKAKIFSFDGTNWAQINTDSFGHSKNRQCRSLCEYDGKLYAGAYNTQQGGEVWVYDGPTPSDWTVIATNGFGTGSNNQDTRSLCAFGGNMYAGTANTTDGTEIWEYDGSAWVRNDPGTNLYFDATRTMVAHGTNLFVGTGNALGEGGNAPGAQAWRYTGGTNWNQINENGFGWTNSSGGYTQMAIQFVLMKDGYLYTGVSESWGNGGNVYRTWIGLAPTHPPVASNDVASTWEDAAVVINVLSNDTDADDDPLTVTTVTQGTNGVVVINGGNANVTYTPTEDWNGTDSFTYTVSDGNGMSDTGTVVVTVANINDPPVAGGDAGTTLEDTPVVINVLTNDTDIDLIVSLAILGVTQGSNGFVVISGGGTNVTYSPNGDWNGADSFTYTVGDWYGGFDTGSVDVIVTPVNDVPVVALVAPTNGSVFWVGDTIGLAASPSDVDGAVTQVMFFAGAAVVGQATGAPWQDTCSLTQTGQYSMTVRAWDDFGGVSTSLAVSVTVMQKALTVIGAGAQNKVYDGTMAGTISGGSLVGVEPGDTVTLENATTGTFSSASAAAGILVTSVMTLGGADAANYSLSQPSLMADITAKGLTVTGAVAQSKVYDSTTAAMITGGALVGVVSGETVTLANNATGTFFQATVGTNIVVSSAMTLDGVHAANYSLSQPALMADITAKGLTVTGAVAQSKVYDRTTDATITGGALAGVVSGDTVTLANNATGTFFQATIGTNIVVSSAMILGGVHAANYSLSQPSLMADITAKGLMVTGAVAQSKIYDGTVDATIAGGALAGVEPGDTVTLVNNTTGTFFQATIGTNIVVSSAMTLVGVDAVNYSLSQPLLMADITAKGLTVTGAVAQSKVYDGTTDAAIIGGTLDGVEPGDTVTLENATTGTFVTANVGTNIAVVSTMTLGGSNVANYSLSQPLLAADITQASQTISFPNPGQQIVTNVTPIAATASSGLGVTLEVVSGPGILSDTNSPATLTYTDPGLVMLRATQPGDTNWGGAVAVEIRFRARADRSAPCDFDGDGMSDLSVYWPEGGNWYIRYNVGGMRLQNWGWSQTVPVPGDYDGDGVTDIAVYWPADVTNNWYILQSSDSQMKFGGPVNWGWSAAVATPSDYDGDGMTDLAVYWPEGGTWYIRYSGGGTRQKNWGWSETVPVPGDYDGDGLADIAVYWPADVTNNWYILQSSDSQMKSGGPIDWGWSAAVPVPGDYDGDGMTDIAVYWPEGGKWYIRYSSGGSREKNWGWSETVPVPGDYDGDGVTDIAVYWPYGGNWYILQSSDGQMKAGGPIAFGWRAAFPTYESYWLHWF